VFPLALVEINVPISIVKEGMLTADYINVINEEGTSVTLAAPNISLTPPVIKRLKRYNAHEIAIQIEDKEISKDPDLSAFIEASKEAKKPKPFKHVTPLMEKIADLELDVPPVTPLIDDELKKEAVSGIRAMFNSVSEGPESNMTTAYQVVKELDDVVEHLVDTISSEANAFIHIADLKSFDEYTYHHSLSVAVLSIAIGQELKLDKAQLKKLGQCAIMHDIGKMTIPLEILNKPGRLTDEEFVIMKNHAENGGLYLEKGKIGDSVLWSAVTHHHEKSDGSGYPKKLGGNAVPFYSQIISVADVYDAVTSFRPYRSPMPPANAIELVMSEVGRAFSYDLVKAFVDKLELYPVNSIVELSDKRMGIVLDNTNAMRPIIQIIEDKSIIDLMGLNYLHLIVTDVVDAGDLDKNRITKRK